MPRRWRLPDDLDAAYGICRRGGIVARMAFNLKDGDTVVFDWNFEDREGVIEKADLPGGQCEVRITNGPEAGKAVRVSQDIVRPKTD